MSRVPQPAQLSADHFTRVLAKRGISEDVAAERGYITSEKEHTAWLKSQGFSADAVSNAVANGAILIPTPDPTGETYWQLRPDAPREIGRPKEPRKYEAQKGIPNGLDVHPRSAKHLDDPSVPLVICESPMKADAMLSAGVPCAVAVRGAWGWRTKGDKGGATVLPDFEAVAFNDGRQVSIVYDSDVATNPNVRAGALRLARMAEQRGSVVTILYPPALPGTKGWGVDDHLASGGILPDLLVLDRQARAEEDASEEEVDVIGPTPEEPVDGAALIEDLIAYQRRYLVTSEDAMIVAAFWVLHTHAIDAADYTPYIVVESPVRRCAKSLNLDVLRLTVRAPLLATDVTVAALFRETKPGHSVFLDEQDGLGDEALRKYLNAGFQRGRIVIRADNERGARATVKFEPFGPKVIASIGNLPDTITDRAFRFKMRRKLASENVERFRERKVIEVTRPLRERAAWWAEQNLDALKVAEPALPEALDDRAQDIAEPLLAIAERIGGRYPQDLADAMVRLRGGSSADDGDEKIRLLADLRRIYDEEGEDFLASEVLAKALAREKDSPWREYGWKRERITPTAMASLLREFGIRPVQHQEGGERARGFYRRQFEDAWARFLVPEDHPSPPSSSRAPVHFGMDKSEECTGARVQTGTEGKMNGVSSNGSEPAPKRIIPKRERRPLTPEEEATFDERERWRQEVTASLRAMDEMS
jgi:hypothetical protein